jgi:hypothetical protein
MEAVSMTERTVVLGVVALLGTGMMAALAGVVYLSVNGVAVPDTLSNMATAALGALSALLASTRTKPIDG